MLFAGAVALARRPQAERLAKYIVWTRELLASQGLPGDPAEHLDTLGAAVNEAGGDASSLSTAVRAELARLEADLAVSADIAGTGGQSPEDASSD